MDPVVLVGNPRTRVNRCYWALRELGVPFEVRQGSPLLAQNYPSPMKKMPVLLDGDHSVYESLAINLYLERAYGHLTPALRPVSAEEIGSLYQFSFFAMTELDPRLFELLFHSARVAKAGHPLANDERYAQYFGRRRSETRRQRLLAELSFPLGVLEDALDGREYLLGSRFTMADLNVSSVMLWALYLSLELGPRTTAWLTRCLGRPLSPLSAPYPADAGGFKHDEAGFTARYGTIGFIEGLESKL